MTPAQQIINEIAKQHRVNPALVPRSGRLQEVVLVRLLVARRLHERGYSLNKIGAVLRRHHTTILYYLGSATRKCMVEERLERQRKPLLPWCAPTFVELEQPPKPRSKRRYLVPYVGAKQEYGYTMKRYQGASR